MVPSRLVGHCWQEWHALWRNRSLLWVLTRREMRSRYAGSAFGVVWAYLQPALMVGAYFLVFDVVFAMRMGEASATSRVGTYLVVGALPWLGFSETLTQGARSLLDAGALLQKNALPPLLFVARSVLAGLLVFMPLIFVLTFAYLPLKGLNTALLAIPLLMLVQSALTLLLAHILAILASAMRDVLQVLAFMLAMGVYLSPVLFPVSLFPSEWRWALFANPMSALVMGYQAVLLQGAWPEGNLWFIVAAWVIGCVLVLNALIRRSRDQLVDWL